MRKALVILAVVSMLAVSASAAPIATTLHGAEEHTLDANIAVGDLLSGNLGTKVGGDFYWGAGVQPGVTDEVVFTDDAGTLGGVAGLLADYQNPSLVMEYQLGGASDIGGIQIYTGNGGKDARIYSSTAIQYDNGSGWQTLGYFQSDPSGSINAGTYASTLVEISDTTGTLISGATALKFYFYPVGNTQGQLNDAWDGPNPWTGVDDGLNAAVQGTLVYEVDVIEVPEPASLALLALGGLFLRRRR